MSDSSSSTISPIFRLDASVWVSIGHLLDYGDAIRLRCTNHVLSERLKRGIRDLRIEWHPSRFIEFHLVDDLISTYPNIKTAIFIQDGCSIRCWQPTAWTTPHSSLTRLVLRFMAAPSLILTRDAALDLVLPSLEHLDIESERCFNNVPAWAKAPDVRFVGLPRSLLTLRVSDSRALYLTLEDFAQLPVGLEELELDFDPDFDSESHENPAVMLPRLPPSVKKIRLKDGLKYWLVRASDLPASLESLQLEGENAPLCFLDSSAELYEDCSLLDFKDVAKHLPNLKSLLLPKSFLSPQAALTFVPPSVTRLDLCLYPSEPSDYDCLDEVVSRFGSKLVKHTVGLWKELDEALLGSPDTPPDQDPGTSIPLIIEEMDHHVHPTNAGVARIPPKTTTLDLGFPLLRDDPLTNGSDSWLPQSVTELKIQKCSPVVPLLNSFISPSYHNRLAELELPDSWEFTTNDWHEALPDSLERLLANIEEESWKEFMTLMATSSRFPKLSYIRNRKAIDIASAFCAVAPQILDLLLSVNVSVGHFETMTEAQFEPLLNSKVDDFRIIIRSDCDASELEKTILFLLNRLPKTLKILCLRSKCALSPKWHWTPPKTLHGFEIIVSDSGESAPVKEEEEGEASCNIAFPDSLSFLVLKNPDDFPDECLPPYLSAFSPGSEAERRYLNSRKPLSPGLSILDPRE